MQNPSTSNSVIVHGAREHNLKNVDVSIPRNSLVVFTGISGSGKSSLAFGTLYAEAQRRYFDSVAPYARRLIHQIGVPEVDSIDGLPPAVALQQHRGTTGTRSTIGSVSTISSLLRMLYSRAGSYPPGQPMLYAEDFSPNTPQGACPTCQGLGHVFEIPEALMVPDPTLSIRQRAIASWPPAWHGQNLRDILVTLGYDVDKPWEQLPKKQRDWILYTEEQPTVPVYAGFTPAETRAALRRKAEPSYQGTFIGARHYVRHTFATTKSALMKRRAARFMTGALCPTCHGKRLKPEALAITFAHTDIGTMSELSLNKLAELLQPAAEGLFPDSDSADADRSTISRSVSKAAVKRRVAAGGSAHQASGDVRRTPNLSIEKRLAAQRIAQGVVRRIGSLQALGLGYLSLGRTTLTLSPGELQRLRLATQIHANLFGVVYVLDEPSAGLHPVDTEALMTSLAQLKQSGNSVFVVEHDLSIVRRADWLVDVGPGAGSQGGEVLYSGPPEGLRDVDRSHTSNYLFDRVRQPGSAARAPSSWLVLRSIGRNNLRDLDVSVPLGVLTCVTGVSGAGKSSLISQALVELIQSHLGHEPVVDPGNESALTSDGPELLWDATQAVTGRIESGAQAVKRLVCVDQKPIGRTPRSNLATYTGLFDDVRQLFAATKAAKAKRYDAGRFSFNVAKGRCDTCEGEGFVMVELLFLPSVYSPCPSCNGARYNPQTLKITWHDRTIADVLNLTVDAACEFFAAQTAIARPLDLLRNMGLGYLKLGQPATELSGGEAQRIKLATELHRSSRRGTLYVLDEPTTGLHPADVDRLMQQIHQLVDAGNSVLIVEHDLRVIAQADWLIDMGPGAGDEGGKIVFCGPPGELSDRIDSRTGPYLRAYLTEQRLHE